MQFRMTSKAHMKKHLLASLILGAMALASSPAFSQAIDIVGVCDMIPKAKVESVVRAALAKEKSVIPAGDRIEVLFECQTPVKAGAMAPYIFYAFAYSNVELEGKSKRVVHYRTYNYGMGEIKMTTYGLEDGAKQLATTTKFR